MKLPCKSTGLLLRSYECSDLIPMITIYWAALHRLRNIWKFKLSKKLKIRFFIAAACESVLLYGSEARTLTKANIYIRKKVWMGHTQECCVWCWVFYGRLSQQRCPTWEVTETIRQDQEQEIKIGGTLHYAS